MLTVEGLSIAIDGNQILHDTNLHIGEGETHVLFGPNGSGKTTLLMAIMGFPRYRITGGRILFKGEDITHLSVDERARRGIGIAFQRPPAIRGVSMRDMALACMRAGENDASVEELAAGLELSGFLDRDVNHGFSGGELKRSELLQLLAQSPELVLLDEPDSGVDLESISLVGSTINQLLQKDLVRTRHHAGLIITHTGHILDYVHADRALIMLDGTIVCSGNPRELLEHIRLVGYRECIECRK